ncbi:MAG TPA: MGMT family protein [Candidatus Omnitrophota bacterium]|nr:MGMT family protein [Candidatus Omnitrophota bacterium]
MSAPEITWSFPVNTKGGVFCLEGTSQGLYRVTFPKGKGEKRKSSLSGGQKQGLVFIRYFKNPGAKLKLRMDLSGCTAFEKQVYRALCKVPPGKVISYSALAKRAGFPGAARAVGSAMRKNRLPVVIPCHRVIHEDGTLGRYSGGIRWKKFLLKHEGSLKK